MKNPLLDALITAFLYMPELKEINDLDYAGVTKDRKDDINKVRKALIDNGINPDELTDQNKGLNN